MSQPSRSVIRGALALMNARLLLEQIGLAALAFGLAVVWLRMPDASPLDVVGSVALALLILVVAGFGETALFLRLTLRKRTAGRLLRGALLIFVGVALWFEWSKLLDHLHANDGLRAGYYNSRFPHGLRNFFSYEHILLWLGWLWKDLAWIGGAVIAVFVFAAIASSRPGRAATRTLRSLTYWIVIVVGLTATTLLTEAMLQWTPGHGFRVEMLSLILRLAFVVLVDGWMACLILCTVAECVRQTNTAYLMSAGTPDDSQPRTVDNP